jgi:type IV secretion system protein VirB2
MGSMGSRLTGRTANRRAGRWPREDASPADPDQLDLGLRVEPCIEPRARGGVAPDLAAADAVRDLAVREANGASEPARTADGTGRMSSTRSVFATLAMLTGLTASIALPRAAWASTGGGAAMPWDTPLQNLLSNLSGPTARALVLIAIVACGLLWAFTRNEEGLKKLGQIAFGGAIALGAVTLVTSLGFSGAVL